MKQIAPLLCMAGLAFATSCAPASATCMTGEPFPYTAPYDMDACPEDIQSWMTHVNLCAHFAGEEPYDEERRAFINAAIAENQCSAIGCDFHALFSRYEGDIAYIGVLSGYAALVYGSADNIPLCPRARD